MSHWPRTLIIDVGNSRVKWAWLQATGLQTVAVSHHEDVWTSWKSITAPQQIFISQVKGVAFNARFIEFCNRHWPGCSYSFFDLKAAQSLGIDSLYSATVGVDRLALCAGLMQLRASLPWQSPSARSTLNERWLVVGAGTATTLDIIELATQTIFHGGYIAPGLRLMRESLSQQSTQLPLQRHDTEQQKHNTHVWHPKVPQDTHDALDQGCVWAQVATIDLVSRQQQVDALLVTGGAAPYLQSGLAQICVAPTFYRDNVVLSGLALWATRRFNPTGKKHLLD